MTSEDVLAEFRAAGALREGHFVLSSGLRSAVFPHKNLALILSLSKDEGGFAGGGAVDA